MRVGSADIEFREVEVYVRWARVYRLWWRCLDIIDDFADRRAGMDGWTIISAVEWLFV